MRQIPQYDGKPAVRSRYAVLQKVEAKAGKIARRFTRAADDATSPALSIPEEWLQAGPEWDVFDITGFAYDHGFDGGWEAAFDTRSDHLSPGL
jgi:hypothetical protein